MIQSQIQTHFDEVVDMGYEVVGVFLQGSQNYDLSYEDSDIDSKAILIPSLNDIVFKNKPKSTTHVRENGEHIDLKDIRLMFDCFKKQNINFVEILFTKYKVLNPKYEALFNQLIDHKEQIARYDTKSAVRCMSGMSKEKYNKLEHPYPTVMDRIDKYGYDPKQLHHILRLNEFIKRYIGGVPYAECLTSNYKEYLISVKKGFFNLEEARQIAKIADEETEKVKNKYITQNHFVIDEEAKNLLDNILMEIIKCHLKSEVN